MILIVGATGLLGGMITRHLLAQGKTVRILVRPNSPSVELAPQGMATAAQSLIDAGAQPVAGDLKDRASLAAACVGIDTVITTANAAMRAGGDTFDSVDLHGTKNLIDEQKGSGRVIVLESSRRGKRLLSARGNKKAVAHMLRLSF